MTAKHSFFPLSIDRQQLLAAFVGIVVVSLLLRLYFALAFPNIHHPDEVFQYLEQAHRSVFGYGVIPWEYRDGIRSWVVPGFLAGIIKISSSLASSEPQMYLALVAAVLSVLSLSVVVIGFLWAYRTQGPLAGIITAVLCGVWFELIYFAPKPLTEAIAAHLLVIAIYLAYPGQPTDSKNRLFAAGIFFGLVVTVRLHLAPALLVAAIYICRQHFRDRWLPLTLGAIIPFSLAGLLDLYTWDYPFQSFFLNVWINVVEQKSHKYGVEPWYFFPKEWILTWGGAIVPIAALALLAARKHILLLLVAAAVVMVHTLVAHKEYRFIFPAVPFVVFLVGLGTAEVLKYLQTTVLGKKQLAAAFAGILVGWVVTSAALSVNSRFRENWLRSSGPLYAFEFLNKKTDLCGIGLIGVGWWMTGGYAYLHRDIPIIIPTGDKSVSYAAYNYAVVDRRDLPDSFPYEKISCWDKQQICVYHRPGVCEEAPAMEINEFLRRTGK